MPVERALIGAATDFEPEADDRAARTTPRNSRPETWYCRAMILSAQLRVQQVRPVMREHSGLRLKDKVVAQFVFNQSPESSPECSGTVSLPCVVCGIQT